MGIRFQDSRPDLWARDDLKELWGPVELANDNARPSRSLYPAAVYAVVLSLAAVLLFLSVCAAAAHDWYPMECCSGQDCAPVDKAESSMPPMSVPSAAAGLVAATPVPELPTLTVTTRHGSAIVPADMPRRPSPDGRSHACIRYGTVLCYFVPPGS